MRPVRRDEIVDYVTYSERRDEIRERAILAKEPRRVHVGPNLTFLFENTETIRYQVQEMMRAEQIVREQDIQHELTTYNELLGGPGELGCTLLIEIETAEERDRLLRQWLPLMDHLYARLPDGKLVRARFDERQVGEERLSSVQYLHFDVGGVTPEALGCDFEGYTHEHVLEPRQRAALSEDLASDAA